MRTNNKDHAFFRIAQSSGLSVVLLFFATTSLFGGAAWLWQRQNAHPSSAQAAVVATAAGDISTVAGNGIGGFSGDGAAATSAQIDAPNGVFVDSVGNLYIADYFNHRVRKVTKSTGFISTIAGTGVAGSLGDGGLATSAQVNAPSTVIVDNAGNVYIGESEGDRVRKINTSGIISTFAGTGVGGYTGDGGLATAAQLNNPGDIAFDSAENLYIAQYSDSVVRKVTASTGIITTVAGNGTSGFSGDGGAATSAEMAGVIGVDVDAAGNIYIVNLNNYRIRKVDVNTGFISTVVGTGTSGFSGDGGLATSAQIGDTFDVSVDSVGNFYISDRSNGRIRKVTVATGIITTVAGDGSGSYCCDGGPALSAGINPVGVFVDLAGNLFIGDNSNDRVRKVEAATVSLPPFSFKFGSSGSGDGQFSVPQSIATDTAGNMYVVDGNNHRIQKFSPVGVFQGCLGGGVAGFQNPCASFSSGSANSQFFLPYGIAIDSAGTMYVADSQNHRIQKFDSSGTFLLKWGKNGGDGTSGAGDGEFIEVWDVALDSFGNVYVADAGNQRVQVFSSGGSFIRKFSASGIRDIAVDSHGDIYTAGVTANTIRKYNNSGSLLLSWGPAGTGDGQINDPVDISVDSSDHVYVADFNNHRIQKFDYIGTFLGKMGKNGGDGTSGPGDGEFSLPRSSFTDSNGRVYIADSGNQRIQVFAIPPFGVSSVTPTQNDVDVNANDNLVIVFNQSLNTGTFSTTTMPFFSNYLERMTGAYTFSTTTSANDTVTFNPSMVLKPGEQVQYVVTTGVQALDASTLAEPFIGTFVVAAANGRGTFTAPNITLAGDSPGDVDRADFDSDGNIDIVASDSGISVFLGVGDGTFDPRVAYTTGSGPSGVAAADFTNDGYADIAVASTFSDNLSIFINNGSGAFAAKVDYPAGQDIKGVAAGDVNGDGFLDVVAGNATDDNMSVFINNGNGTFAARVNYTANNAPALPVLGDLDADGDLDIIVPNQESANVSVFLNNGVGVFAAKVDYTTGVYPWQVVAVDLNGDSDLDLVTVNQAENSVSVLSNNGSGVFAAKVDYAVGASPFRLASGDFDTDGDIDIVTTSYDGHTVAVLLNNGAGLLAAAVTYPAGAGAHGVTTADINGDNAIDIITSNWIADTIAVLFGDITAPNVTLVQPNGGESLIVGSSYDIIWRATDNSVNISTVNLTYTIDDSNYDPVSGGTGLANGLAYPFLLDWGTAGTGPGQFGQAYGIAVDSAGNVYVSDYPNHRIQKFSASGVYVTEWSTGIGSFPSAIATDSAGNVYVALAGASSIHKYTSSGVSITSWGTNGTGNGQFSGLSGLAVDPSGFVYAGDTNNNRVQKFTSVGVYVMQWGTAGTGDGKFTYPRGIASDTAGFIYVVDNGNNRVQKFDNVGNYQTQWGTAGTGNGQLSNPYDIAIDSVNRVFVSDTNNDRIQRFTSSGVYQMQWGAAGSADGEFSVPIGIASDSTGHIYVADLNRVQKFSPGGSLSWTVPASATTMARVLVTALDAGGLDNADDSDNLFTISSGGGSSIQRIQQANTPVAPTAQTGAATATDTIRWSFTDNAANELGFRLIDADGNILIDVALPDQSFIDETGLVANTEYSGRVVVAYNDSGESVLSDAFPPVVTAMPAFQAVVAGTTANSMTVGVNAAVPNLTAGTSGLLFELLPVSGSAQASAILSSGWVQTSTHTFEGLVAGVEYQARVKARNQASAETVWSTYTPPIQLGELPPAGTPSFDLELALSQNNTPIARGQTLNPLQSVQGLITFKNVGNAAATNVLVNMLIPSYMFLSEDSLRIDGSVQSAAVDTDAAQGNSNSVSAIWARVEPQEQHTIAFTLFFDIESLRALLAQASAAVNPMIGLQVSLSASEFDAPIFAPTFTIEPNLALLTPATEPTPPSPDIAETIKTVLEETFPAPGEPAFEAIPQGETSTTSQNGSFTLVTTDGEQQLTVDGTAQSTDDRLEFMGTTSQPFTTVMLIFNGSVSTIVVSDANGTWRTFVSAAELGINEGEAAQVTIEAIAAKGDLRSERVQIASILVSRVRSGEIVADFDTLLSPDSITAVFDAATEALRENEATISASLAVSVPVVIVSSVPLWGYLPYVPTLIYHFIGWMVGVVVRRKKGDQATFGVVYDAITKLPLPMAIIRLYDANKKLVSTHVTDKQGRYDALLAPGVYTVQVTKPSYHYPSAIITTPVDGDYTRVYDRQIGVTIATTGASTLPQIPLDPVNMRRQWDLASGLRKLWLAFQRLGNHLATPILVVGSIMAGALVIANPERVANWLITVLYVIAMVSQLKLKPKLIKAWGVVYDVASNAILPLVTIQLIERATSKVVTSRLSDYEGRFTFLPEPGSYVVKASKPGFTQVTEVVQSPFTDRQPLPQTIDIKKPSERVSGDVAMKQGN